jgi:hypothetical protein
VSKNKDSWFINSLKVVSMSVISVQVVLQKKSMVLPMLKKYKKKGEKISYKFPDFNYQLVNGEECPQCVVCGEVLANDSLNARNLCRHLTRRHASLANKPQEFFDKTC